MNCLECGLHLWKQQPELKLWYNSNHVLAIEPEIDLNTIGYLPIEAFGVDHFISSFDITNQDTLKSLKSYFESL